MTAIGMIHAALEMNTTEKITTHTMRAVRVTEGPKNQVKKSFQIFRTAAAIGSGGRLRFASMTGVAVAGCCCTGPKYIPSLSTSSMTNGFLDAASTVGR